MVNFKIYDITTRLTNNKIKYLKKQRQSGNVVWWSSGESGLVDKALRLEWEAPGSILTRCSPRLSDPTPLQGPR